MAPVWLQRPLSAGHDSSATPPANSHYTWGRKKISSESGKKKHSKVTQLGELLEKAAVSIALKLLYENIWSTLTYAVRKHVNTFRIFRFFLGDSNILCLQCLCPKLRMNLICSHILKSHDLFFFSIVLALVYLLWIVSINVCWPDQHATVPAAHVFAKYEAVECAGSEQVCELAEGLFE